MSRLLAAFLNAGIAGGAVTVAVWLALWIAPRRAINAATRYAVWWTTLLVVVALPMFYLPHRAIPVPAIPAPIAELVTPAATQSVSVAVTEIPAVSAGQPVPLRWPQFPLEFSAGAWPIRIFGAWGAVTLLLLLRLGASYVLLEQRKRHARPAENLRRWPVRALISSDIASPMAAGLFRPAILLPERLIDELDDDELDQIRVHETAHLTRRDDIALLIQRTVEAVLPLHPVVRWITRRIDLEREIACDDFVVEQTGRARPYASCLTRVVEIAGGGRSSVIDASVAAAATAERSHLARRIEMLLDKTRHKGTRLLKTPLLLMVAALIVLACVAVRTPGIIAFAAEGNDSFFNQVPVPPEQPSVPEASAAPEAPALAVAPVPPTPAVPPAPAVPPVSAATPEPQFESHGDRTITSRWNDGLHAREMKIHGDVHFTDDETDVKSMSADGFFSYEESFGFASRRYQVTSDSSGRIARRYFVDAREKALDDDARAWLRAAIPELVRESAIDAPERVRRILKQGGASAVLAEIAKIHSDGAKQVYIRELVPIGNLNMDQFQSMLRLVRGMNSDGDKATLLVFLAPYTLKDNLRDYTFEALKTIHSDGDKHRVLTEFILADPSRGTLTLVARAAADINSDGDKASVLVDLAAHLRGNSDLSHPFFRAAESIHSDGDRARVLMAVMASAGEQRDVLVDAIHAAESINSDGDKAGVLVHADAYWKDDDLLRRAYFETARSIHSDGDKARVLTSLIGRAGLSGRTLVEAVHCATTINSDGDKAHVLIAVANQSNGKPEVRDEIKTAAGTIHSDGDYRRVMTAIDLRAANRP